MAFSIVGIFAVLLETFRPFVPLLVAWVVIDAVLIAYTAPRGQFAHKTARRMAVFIGVACMVIAFLSGPALTQATFSDFISAIDWVLLGAMAFGVGVTTFALTLPITSLLKS
ncbi:MAG TPA: hypothetical protein VIC53_05280 [Wenzhouxiangella sp.]